MAGAWPDAAENPGGGPPSDAEELWVEVKDPPICGRIDQVRDWKLIDFKTGEPDLDGHRDQLLFYAALWWLRFGTLPAGMEIRYPDATYPLQVPEPSELTAEIESLRRELASIGSALVSPPPPAKPGLETCRHCAVRQLCPDYWAAASTRPHRGLPTDADGSGEAATPFRDIRLTALPAHWEPGKALHGAALLDGGESVEVTIPVAQCPAASCRQLAGVTILDTLLTKSDNGWRAKLTSASEVFWEVGRSG
jgi:hypothetical protein